MLIGECRFDLQQESVTVGEISRQLAEVQKLTLISLEGVLPTEVDDFQHLLLNSVSIWRGALSFQQLQQPPIKTFHLATCFIKLSRHFHRR